MCQQKNTLNEGGQTTLQLSYRPQGQVLRFSHGWLKISSGPKYHQYDWVDHMQGSRNQVLGKVIHLHISMALGKLNPGVPKGSRLRPWILTPPF